MKQTAAIVREQKKLEFERGTWHGIYYLRDCCSYSYSHSCGLFIKSKMPQVQEAYGNTAFIKKNRVNTYFV